MLMNISTNFHACIRMCMIMVTSRSTNQCHMTIKFDVFVNVDHDRQPSYVILVTLINFLKHHVLLLLSCPYVLPHRSLKPML